MNEIAIGVFFWLLKIAAAYLAVLIVLTIFLSRRKKKLKQESEESEQTPKKRITKRMWSKPALVFVVQ